MTSALSHPQRLSGNNCLAVILCLTLAACAGLKPGQSPDLPDVVAKEVPKVYNPETGTYEPVDDPSALVDTVTWTVEPDAPEPIGSTIGIKGERKEIYDVALLIPFQADRNQSFADRVSPKARRFMQYYAGIRMAAEDLSRQSNPVRLKVFDTRESETRCSELMRSPEVREADLVIGPYTRNNVRSAAEFAMRYQTTVVSPWMPSAQITEENPYFVQLTPGLPLHAQAIIQYLDRYYSDAKVYLVSRNAGRERSRLGYFQDAYQTVMDDPSAVLEELIVQDTTMDLSETDLTTVILEDQRTVFVLPYYSRADEDYVNILLRKLHADRLENEVIVFGMPQWLSFRKLNGDYLESLNAHVSSAAFSARSDPQVREFRQRFFERFRTVPEQAAYQGYDVMKFFGQMLFKHGTAFLSEKDSSTGTTLNLGFDIRPVITLPESERLEKVDFYENQHIYMLKFEDQEFQIAEQ